MTNSSSRTDSGGIVWQMTLGEPVWCSDRGDSAGPVSEYCFEIVDGHQVILGLPMSGDEACAVLNAITDHAPDLGITIRIDVGMLDLLPAQLKGCFG